MGEEGDELVSSGLAESGSCKKIAEKKQFKVRKENRVWKNGGKEG